MIWIDEEALKAAMKRAGVDTFTALAEKAGISTKTLYNVLHGRSAPSLATAYRIKRTLQLKDSEFFEVFPES